jgi:excinuclease ABC subunit B
MYADKMTDAMQRTIDETNRRRSLQMSHNEDHGLVPKQIVKKLSNPLSEVRGKEDTYEQTNGPAIAADPVIQYMSIEQIERSILNTQDMMKKAAKDLDFIEAARLRDEMYALESLLKQKKGK